MSRTGADYGPYGPYRINGTRPAAFRGDGGAANKGLRTATGGDQDRSEVLKDRAELTQAWKTIRQQNADLARLKRVEGVLWLLSRSSPSVGGLMHIHPRLAWRCRGSCSTSTARRRSSLTDPPTSLPQRTGCLQALIQSRPSPCATCMLLHPSWAQVFSREPACRITSHHCQSLAQHRHHRSDHFGLLPRGAPHQRSRHHRW